MSTNERDPLHEKLCAWILGEATPDEAREVEAALAASADLREERARLEATIGAVRGAFAAPESLSGEALERLLAAASTGTGERHALRAVPPARPRTLGVALRAAAAVTVLLGGVLAALRVAEEHRAEQRPGVALDTARLETRERAASAPRDGEADGRAKVGFDVATEQEVDEAQLPLIEGLGYLEGDETGGVPLVAASRAQDRLTPPAEAPPGAASEPSPALETTTGRLAELGLKDSVEGLDKKTTVLRAEVVQEKAEIGAPTGPATPSATPPASAGGEPSRRAGEVATLGERYRQYDDDGAPRRLRELGYGADSDVASSGAVPRETRSEAARAVDELAELEANRRGKAGAGQGPPDALPDLDFYLGKEARQEVAGEDKLAALGGLGYSADDGEEPAAGLLAIPRSLDGLRQGRHLDEDELRRLGAELHRRYLDDCRRRPHETPRDMYFRYWGDNPFEDTVRDRLSTFSVDVDTASYVLARRYLREGHLPPRAQVRTEEFVNYFTPDLAPPLEGTFALSTELAPSRFGGSGERWMLRVGIRGKEVAREERPPLSLTFVVDVSGSMKEGQRLELVKHAVRLLVAQLDARDAIGIVAFSSEARLILPLTSAGRRDLIESALQPLRPEGSTNAEAGLKMGYELARTGLDPASHSRVVFLSDGVANTGQTDQDRITSDVARARAEGIYLNTIGVGMNNHNDVLLEQLADKGDGICDYVDDEASARRAIVERFTGALIPIASDVKVQVDFDPARVLRYRLLGYENRAVADRDFRNDAVDAGEVGAGHQVVALYELELAPERDGAPLAVVHLRWKEPKVADLHANEVPVGEISAQIPWSSAVASFASASPGYRLTVLAAQLAELLRRSSHAVDDSFVTLFEEARALVRSHGDPEAQELLELVARAIELGLPAELQHDALQAVLDEYRRQQILEARLEEVERSQRVEELREELRRRNEDLERRLQEVLLEELRRRNG